MAVVIAVAVGLGIVRTPPVIALLAPATIGVLALVLLTRNLSRGEDASAQRRLLTWTLTAFGVHVLLGLAIHGVGARLLAETDASYYHDAAGQIVDHWTRGFPLPVLPSGKEGFFYLLSVVYWVFGPSPVAGLMVNAVMAAAVVPILSDTTRRLVGSSAARHLPPLLVLLPSFLMWSSQLLREAGVLFLVAVAANCAVRLGDHLAPGRFVGLAASLALLFTFRGNVALLVAGGLLAGLAIGRRELLSGLTLGIGTLVVLLILVLGLGLGYSGYRISVQADLREVDAVRSDLSVTSESGFASEADISTPARAVSYLPIGATNFFLGPFPWQLRSARQLVALPDVVVWWFLLPSLWRGLWAAKRRIGRRLMTLLIPATMTGAALALLIGNFGTVVRERPQVTILLLPFVALGLSERRRERSGAPEREPGQGDGSPGRLALLTPARP